MKGLAIFGAVLLAASVFAAELILQPDPAKGKDSMVSVNSPTRNYGTYPYLMVNYGPGKTVRGIVEFTGLSKIPKGSTVNSAVIELYSRANSPRDYFGI